MFLVTDYNLNTITSLIYDVWHDQAKSAVGSYTHVEGRTDFVLIEAFVYRD